MTTLEQEIDEAIAHAGIKNRRELARLTGIPESSLSNKVRRRVSMTMPEFAAIVRQTRMDDARIGKIVRSFL